MAETTEQILIRMLSDIDDKYDKTEGSFIFDTQKPVAIENEKIYKRINAIADKAFVGTATGSDLDAKIAEIGMQRKSGSYAYGTVTITGLSAAAVPEGTKVLSALYTFTITESAIVGVSGTVDVMAVCDTLGSGGNVPAGSIQDFETSVTGLTGVTNQGAFIGGYDIETDEEVRARFRALTSKPTTSGNKYHYEAWAKEVNGVGDAKCIPRWNGAGTVKVIIINNDREAASQELINSVADHIESERPVGATVTVASASPLLINVSATLTLQSGYTTSSVLPFVEEAVSAYIKDIAFEQAYVSYAHIGRCILGIDGIIDYADLQVNDGVANIDIDADEVPVLGVVTVE